MRLKVASRLLNIARRRPGDMAGMLCCEICKTTVNKDELNILEQYLPDGYSHTICEFERSGDSPNAFKTLIRLAMDKKEEAIKWFDEFQEKSCTTWRVSKTYPESSGDETRRKNTFRADYRCHHNTRPRSKTANGRASSKNTNCPATLYLVVKRSSDKSGRVRSTDKHLTSGFVTVCRLNNGHNHEIYSADVLRKRDVSSTVKEKLIQLFKSGYSPPTALDIYKRDLQKEAGDDFIRLSADRHYCPDEPYCYRLYYSIFKKEHDMELKLDEYNKEQGSVCSSIATNDDGQTVVAICTPLMKRIHQYWPYSGELCFVDSTGAMDGQNCVVFLLLTRCPAGGLPLGVIVSSSETERTIVFGLEKLKSLLPEAAFYGRGAQGPMMFMTADSNAERMALQSSYPASCLLLCTFHVLQALWIWLWDRNNNICKTDRPLLLQKVKDMLYAETVPELEKCYNSALTDVVCQRYPNFIQRLRELYDRTDEWALACRKDLPVRNDTNNFAEAAMRILREKVLCRTKAYNVSQLVDYMTTTLNHYYERKLIDVANNRLSGNMITKFFPNNNTIIPDYAVTKMSEHEYEVKSKSKKHETYQVSMDFGICTCNVGRSGGPCKHQAAVIKKFNLDTSNFLLDSSPEFRALMCKIATGNERIGKNWFQPLRSGIASHSGDNQVMEVEVTNMCGTVDDAEMHQAIEIIQDPGVPRNGSSRAQSELLTIYAGHKPNQPCTAAAATTSLQTQLEEVFVDLNQRLESDPETFAVPLKAFVSTYSKITTQSQLVSALHAFGKRPGAALSARNISKKAKTSLLRPSKQRKVPLTGGSRRRILLGGRRRRLVGQPKDEYWQKTGNF